MPRILVVQGNPAMFYTISQMLEAQGYAVLLAINGDEALQFALDDKPDVILLDVILPKLNGYQVCRQIKSNSETEAIPVVMLTSSTRNQNCQWGIDQRADDYVIKPVEEEVLLDVIQRYVPRGTNA